VDRGDAGLGEWDAGLVTVALRPYQETAIEGVREAFRAGHRAPLLVAPTGAGKCLARGTPVLMFDGTILSVEDVQVGDLLMGPDSTPRRVASLARGQEEMFRVTPSKGDPYTVNRSHILSLSMTGGSLNSCGIPDGTVVNITVDEYLTRTKTFRHCAKGWRTAVDFQARPEPLPLDPYFLGVWLGDGDSKGPGITTGDPEIREAVFACAEAFGLAVREQPNSPGSVVLFPTTGERGPGRGHRTNPVTLALHRLDLLHNKHVPHCYLIASRADRLELLAGFLDADGSWYGKGYDVVLKSERLMDDLLFLTRSLGFSAYKASTQKTCGNNGAVGEYWRCHINGPVETIPCRLPRKQATARRQKKDPLLTGISVESVGEGDYYGFEIAGPDRLFLLGDFTVTHNTVMFGYVSQQTAARGKRVLILAHRKELIRQASHKLYDANLPHGIIAPGHTPTRDLVQVASVQTLGRRLQDPRYSAPDLIVVDEAHHAVAGQWRDVVNAYPAARILGVTATPERLDGKGLGIVAGGIFDAMVVGPTVGDLVGGGFLTPTRIFAPAEAPDLSGIRTRGGDFEAGALADAMGKAQLVGDAVKHYAKHTPGQPAILFSPSVAHAEAMAEAFRTAGWRAQAASGSTPGPQRDAAIAGLATGAVQVLCSCDLISEGLDVPAVGAVILMRPTKSLGLYLQQVGRGLRPAPGKTHLTVLDHAGNTLRHGPPEIPRQWSLEGRKKKEREAIPPTRQCPECFAVHSPTPECPECGFVYEVKSREIEHVEGDLADVTDLIAERWGKHRPLSQVLREARDEDLKAIAKVRGYKSGWVKHVMRARQGVAA